MLTILAENAVVSANDAPRLLVPGRTLLAIIAGCGVNYSQGDGIHYPQGILVALSVGIQSDIVSTRVRFCPNREGLLLRLGLPENPLGGLRRAFEVFHDGSRCTSRHNTTAR